jgi:hypothetical protein
MTRTSKIISKPNNSSLKGPDMQFAVELYEDGVLVETRDLPGKSRHYALDVSEKWDTGLITLEKK